MSLPEGLQIEPTNKCNLACVMCVRNTWRGEKFGQMDFGLYQKIIDETQGSLRRLALYGFGEPLTHPRFPDMVRYAREASDSTYILTVTNGTLMTREMTEKVFGAGIDEIAFSIDAPELGLLSKIRVGTATYDVLGNLTSAAKIKDDYDVRLGITVVLMKWNYKLLPDIARKAGELGLDFLAVSHLVPYTEAMMKETVYTTASRQAVEFYEKHAGDLEELAKEAIYDVMLQHYTLTSSGKKQLYLQLVDKLGSSGYSLNVDISRDAVQRKELLSEVEMYIEKAASIAKEYGLEVKLPNVYADANKRSCPYIDLNYAMILWNGDVVPCMDLAYTHPLYTNLHPKTIKKLVFGNVEKQSLSDVWSSSSFKWFRETRKNLSKNVPWCGDCQFATRDCWYIRVNEYDCYGNEVGCNECIYSAGLAHCLI
ncbi:MULTISPECIES: SPASM domain-containing protein [Thermofilum]|nr:SPASM domain-containing protein [Thermofilum adornatum]